jgi:N-methylhydantoinase B
LEETKDPVIIERYELITDSAGAGTFRGGLGVRRDYRMHMDGRMISILERCDSPAKGVNGGGTARATTGVMDSSIYGQGVPFKKTPDRPFAAGDLISIQTGGGGGWGHPKERLVESVVQDVKDGYVSLEAARVTYGVVIDPSSYEVTRLER